MVAVCVAFVAHFFWSHHAEIAEQIDLRPASLLLLVLLQAVQFALQAYRQKQILEQSAQVHMPFRPWIGMFVVSRLLNQVIPQSGNVYRSVELKQLHNISLTHYVSSLVAAGWLGMAFNFALAALAIAVIGGADMRLWGIPAPVLLIGCAALNVAAPLVIAKLVPKLPPLAHPRVDWLRRKMTAVVDASVRGFARISFLVPFVGVSLASFAVAVASLAVAFHSLSVRVDLSSLILFQVVMQLSSIVIVTPGNLGITEIGAGLVGHVLGMGMGPGMLVSALMRLTGVATLILIALPLGGWRILRARAAAPSADSDPPSEPG